MRKLQNIEIRGNSPPPPVINILTCDKYTVDKVSIELASLSDTTRHNGGSRGGKHKLEEPGWVRGGLHPVAEEVGTPDEAIAIGPVGHGPANSPVCKAAN